MVRRRAWLELGPLDEAFYFYFEEADWQKRALDAGWDFRVLQDEVCHGGSGSADKQVLELQMLATEGYERFIRKHEGLAGLILHRSVNAPGVLRTAYMPRRQSPPSLEDTASQIAAKARLKQLLRRVPPVGRSPWAERRRRER